MSNMTPEDVQRCRERTLVKDERLHTALIEFMASIGSALDICSYGLIIGDSYVPFDPDEEDEDECVNEDYGFSCEQAWVRVAGVNPIGGVDSFDGICGQEMQLQLEVGVLRCLPIPDEGAAPKTTDMLKATLQAMDDMNAMYRGAMAVGIDGDDDLFDTLEAGDWSPVGPLGGQYGGIWAFTATL